jgi:hypothetical protein
LKSSPKHAYISCTASAAKHSAAAVPVSPVA